VKSVYPNFFFILKLASLHYLTVANTRVSRDLRVSRRCSLRGGDIEKGKNFGASEDQLLATKIVF
jgi:hypothetical protein